MEIMEKDSNREEKLIQISTPSCYYCIIAKQYISLRLLKNYIYLDLSKLTEAKKAKKYMKNIGSVLAFFIENKEGNVIDTWTGFNKKKIDEFINKYND